MFLIRCLIRSKVPGWAGEPLASPGTADATGPATSGPTGQRLRVEDAMEPVDDAPARLRVPLGPVEADRRDLALRGLQDEPLVAEAYGTSLQSPQDAAAVAPPLGVGVDPHARDGAGGALLTQQGAHGDDPAALQADQELATGLQVDLGD